jgi:amino acid efflux transporter
MVWHENQTSADMAQFAVVKAALPGDICHRVRTDSGEHECVTETASRIARPAVMPAAERAGHRPLTTTRGAALYIGALLGPGLLLLPGLAAAVAGPASLLAWIGLLIVSGLFAVVFAALGRRYPSAGGVMGYVTAGLGPKAGSVAGWSFLAGVVTGAPVVCLIGASYVTELTGGGRLVRAAIAALLLLMVLMLAARGLRESARAQLFLMGLLIVVVAVAVAGSAGAARAANWAPFAPHGWLAVGHAAATLMLSFVGWEAVAPLTTQFADPARQLARVVAIALAVTSALYLGLAVVTIAVLGQGAASMTPLADLLQRAIGPAGMVTAAIAAVVLTLGTVNAYINGAVAMAGQLSGTRAGRAAGREAGASQESGAGHDEGGDADRSRLPFLGAIAASGLVLITLYGIGLVNPEQLVAIPTTLFLAVYLGAMTAAARMLRGPARWAAVPATIAVLVMLGYCGWALAVPALVAVIVLARRASGREKRLEG